jgi:small-conductance mechanosensitive channel
MKFFKSSRDASIALVALIAFMLVAIIFGFFGLSPKDLTLEVSTVAGAFLWFIVAVVFIVRMVQGGHLRAKHTLDTDTGGHMAKDAGPLQTLVARVSGQPSLRLVRASA